MNNNLHNNNKEQSKIEDFLEKGKSLYKDILESDKDSSNELYPFIEWKRDFDNIYVQGAWRKIWFKRNKERIYLVASSAAIIIFSLMLVISRVSDSTSTSIEVIVNDIFPVSDNIVLRTSKGQAYIVDSLVASQVIDGGVVGSGQIRYDSVQEIEQFKEADKNNKKKSEDIEVDINRRDRETSVVQLNELYVPKGRIFSIILDDGTQVWINSQTTIKYPAQFSKNERIVYVDGEAFFDVKSDGRRFIVKTQNYSVNVLGTKFNVSSYGNDSHVSTTLIEGSVMLSYDSSSEYVISPGQQFIYNKTNGSVSIKRVDTDRFTCWMDNQLRPDKSSIEEIFNILTRKYDIDVFFADEEAKSRKLSGDLPLNSNLRVILNQISKVTDLEFSVEGKLIVVNVKK